MHSGERRSLNFDPELSLLHKMVTSSFIIGSKFPSTGHFVHKIHNLKMPFWLTISSFSFKSIGLVFAWLGLVHVSSKLVWFDIHQSNRNQILKLAFLQNLLSSVWWIFSRQNSKISWKQERACSAYLCWKNLVLPRWKLIKKREWINAYLPPKLPSLSALFRRTKSPLLLAYLNSMRTRGVEGWG